MDLSTFRAGGGFIVIFDTQKDRNLSAQNFYFSIFRGGGFGGFIIIFDTQKDRNLSAQNFITLPHVRGGGLPRSLKQPGDKLFIWKVPETRTCHIARFAKCTFY